ncbi:putative metal-binding motif-containing protein [Myxococcus sp. CA040A]|uniref:putative metal-binding motif-containing protein n=1 Tax=Myxococcus sp. CA040A TaxID=2741738 RepID=UPI00157ADCB1|nr:putative metal-binding motif-containing protein [Myxococcus sp. CA040A]NTX05776.1 hypothetical protein [Myxococcus sp. CA040A]
MSRLGCLVVVSLLVLGGCSVPSLEDLEAERGVRITVDYSPSFKTGCIVMRTQDEANPANFTEQTVEGSALSRQTPPLELRAFRRGDWSKKVRVTLTAHEQTCAGKAVDRVELVGEAGRSLAAVLATPDADGDGYVAILGSNRGGTDCDDTDVMNSPGQPEICDDKDNNCSGAADETLTRVAMFRDRDNDGVGSESTIHCVPAAGVTGYVSVGGDCKDDDATIAPGKTDVCDDKDNNCDGATDEGSDKNWYQDGDQDGSLSAATGKVQCGQPDASYRQRFQSEAFDCNDHDGNNTPGRVESCDNADNNCDGSADEAFPTKGTSCNLPSVSCAGTWVCTGNQLAVECNARAPRLFYPDRDGDGDGDQNATVDEVCANETPQVGHVENVHGDCDDVDPAARSGLTEVCDAIDNNCNAGVSDEPLSCGGTLKDVVSYHLSSGSQDWRTVAVGQGGYPVWVAGHGGKLAVRKAAHQKFESYSFGDTANPSPPDGSPPLNTNHCGDHNWTVSWVDSSGAVILGGEGGWVARHTGTSAPCGPGTLPTSQNITGMVGFESGGVTTVYLFDTNGRLYRWVVGAAGNPFTELNDNITNLYGLHALREDFMLAVGGTTGPDRQRFVSYAVTTGTTPTGTPTAHTANPNNVSGKATAVWMGNADKACAVGEGGAVWRWDGATTWDKTDAPSAFDFTSVVMRYDAQNPQHPLNEQCYMVDKRTGGFGGKLHRLTPYGWAKGPDLTGSLANVPLNDIAITAAGDLWIVGDDGRVFHYPEP